MGLGARELSEGRPSRGASKACSGGRGLSLKEDVLCCTLSILLLPFCSLLPREPLCLCVPWVGVSRKSCPAQSCPYRSFHLHLLRAAAVPVSFRSLLKHRSENLFPGLGCKPLLSSSLSFCVKPCFLDFGCNYFGSVCHLLQCTILTDEAIFILAGNRGGALLP